MEWPAPPSGEIILPETQTEERIMKIAIAVLGIDLGKNVCSIVGLDASGAVVLRRRVRRDTLIDLVAKLPGCIVGMEACCGAEALLDMQTLHRSIAVHSFQSVQLPGWRTPRRWRANQIETGCSAAAAIKDG